MRQDTLDYRSPSTPAEPRSVLWMVVVAATSVHLAVSIICCIATWNSPKRFIFLPGGDVGLGFRSYAGCVDWIEYAPWVANPDYVKWSVPWAAVFAADALIIFLCVRRR